MKRERLDVEGGWVAALIAIVCFAALITTVVVLAVTR